MENLEEYQVSLSLVNIFVGAFLIKMTSTNTYSLLNQIKKYTNTFIGTEWLIFFMILIMIMLNAGTLFKFKDQVYNPDEEDTEEFGIFVTTNVFNFAVYSIILLVGVIMAFGNKHIDYSLIKNPVGLIGSSVGLFIVSFILLILNGILFSKLKPIM